MTRTRWVVVAVVAMVIAGVSMFTPVRDVVRRWLSGPRSQATMTTASTDPSAEAGSGSAAPARGEVSIDARRQQLIGVTTDAVVKGPLEPEVRASGVVVYDETKQVEINTRVSGWIRELSADYTGKPVRVGEVLFTLYSPELLATENEFLLAHKGHDQAGHAEVESVRAYSDRLLQAARDRLSVWDLSPADVEDLERRGQATGVITFRSPANGVLVEKAAIKGMRVQAGQMLFRIADVSTVWIEADVYERDLGLVHAGAAATLTFDAYPGESFAARASYIAPSLIAATRTTKARFQLSNARGRFKPGMFATVVIRGPVSTGLTVPANALIDSGTTQVVFVAAGDGYFTPRTVKVGRRVGGRVELVDGVKEGEQVASSATFFLDSESQLRGALQDYQPPSGAHPSPASTGTALDIAFQPTSDPPRAGENTFEVRVKDASGKAVTDAKVSVRLSMPAMPAMNMPAIQSETTLTHEGAGVYRGTGQVLTGGRWDVTVTARKESQELGRKQFALVAR